MNDLTSTADDDAGRYRRLVQAVTDYAIYMLDPSGIVISWNAGAQRFKGYTPEEIIGRHFSRFYTEEARKSGLPERALATAAREGKFESEGWRVRRDGTQFWAHVVIDPIRDPNGMLTGYAKITRDLTERKIAEEALRRSDELFRRLVQGVTDYAIYMLSPKGDVTNWNTGAQRIKGYLPEEIVGKNFSQFYTEEDRQAGEPERILDIALKEGRVQKEGWRVRKDGTRFWSHVVIDAIRDDGGTVMGFAKITRDITERKNAEAKLVQAREALFQSQKMEAIGQLTGGVAHDFNNLLMAILGSLSLLRKRLPEDNQMLRLLDNATAGANRGVALTQRMLAFARRQEIDLVPLELPALVRGMTELLDRSVSAQAAIETRFPLSLSRVVADANQLELAVLNICVNARDAMPDGGTILISAREQQVGPGHATNLPEGRYVCLAVSDTGEGMSEETLAHATEPFFTTKGVGKGTGLGLSMVHGMAEQMGGRLMLKSTKGEGTTAEIWLPAAAPDAQTKSGKPDAAKKAKGRKLRVLAVDDDALVLFNTSAMLEDLGHTVFEVSSGSAALQALRRHEIDLVITDQAMPKMTGLQLLDVIKTEWPGLPVVIATGYAELPGGLRGNIPRLSKPFSEDELSQILAKLAPATP
uniref:histidine kinase n=1 Tax=uncultured bacterium BLR7 TaxID=506523 RepID=C0INQ2_9BACT|nr:putative two component fused sensor/regulator transcriptional regulator [uncultured bacterium BLR7]